RPVGRVAANFKNPRNVGCTTQATSFDRLLKGEEPPDRGHTFRSLTWTDVAKLTQPSPLLTLRPTPVRTDAFSALPFGPTTRDATGSPPAGSESSGPRPHDHRCRCRTGPSDISTRRSSCASSA